MVTSVLDRLRQPEYTGENRCIPCTAANVVIAAAVGLAAGYVWSVAGWPLAWLVGTLALATGLASVWLRGYFVPGTPELTKRYFPDWLLQAFDKGPEPGTSPGGLGAGVDEGSADSAGHPAEDPADDAASAPAENPPGEPDVETMLLSAGVVEPCEHEDDLCLVEAFRSGWHERMETIREDGTERDELARELDLDPADIEFEDHGDAFVARNEGHRLGQWESRAALVADLAAARELPRWIDSWDDLPVGGRSQMLGGLRIFLETCPVCEGPVSAGMETVESCCRSHDVVAANCEACDSRLLEVMYREPA